MIDDRARSNATLLRRLLAVAGGAFLFAFALVPLYRIACEQVFGIKLAQGAANASQVGAMVIDRS
ncbi:MAG TPA: cytochrome c oxidase assembly protein, partial [Candidatus Saccharimonadia bacterium]|nr:cytochrome c oxidase assembly protein [Candidatus Saccharimonadia bacterium]